MLKGKPAWIALPAVLLLSGCAAEQRYGAAQGWQRNQCAGIPDKAEYDRCMAGAGTSYESYRRQTESGQKQ